MVKGKLKTQDIIKGISAGLCLLDRNFRIVWTNKLQSDWFGLPCDIYGKYCYKIYQHRRHVCPGCPTAKVFKTGTTQLVKSARGFTKEGQKRYYQLTVSPIKDNQKKVVFALELVQDVTARIIQERFNSKIMHKLKHMYSHLSLVNKRLCNNIHRLKQITRNLSQIKHMLEEKYRKKKNQLLLVKEELQDIFKVNRILSSTIDLKKISALITHFTCELMRTDACVLRLVDAQKKILTPASSYGINKGLIKEIPVAKIGEGVSGWVAAAKKPLSVYDVEKDLHVKHIDLLKKLGVKTLLAVPVILQGEVLGVISTYSKKQRYFSKEEIKLLTIFAAQVAIAMQEVKHYKDIHTNYFNTIHTLVLAVEARDPYTRGHTERVTKYALEIGRNLNMHQTELEILRYAGEVHDVGKISIPDFILSKPGRLTPAERAMIEFHPVRGAEMLEPLEFLKPAIPVVRHHHERYDGTGYPDGLEKDKIPLMARILACADAFDAMTADRPYRRRKLTINEALSEIKNNAGSQFDPQIAHLFIKVIRNSSPLKTLS